MSDHLDAAAINAIADLGARAAQNANELKKCTITVIEGLPHVLNKPPEFEDPSPDTLEVDTLSGILALLPMVNESTSFAAIRDRTIEQLKEAGPFDATMLIVQDAETVVALPKAANRWGNRPTLVKADAPVASENFGRFLEQEPFAIWIETGFVQNEDSIYLIDRSRRIVAATEIAHTDTGVAQEASLKRSVSVNALKDNEVLKRRVKLAPYRTFREVAQPTSEFVFRIKDNGQGAPPTLALIEADGGTWEQEAMDNIAAFLKKDNLVTVIR